MISPARNPSEKPEKGFVLTKAAVNAADRLGLTARALASVIGVSEPTVSRMKTGQFLLEEGSKPYELAALLVRLFRSLDAITGGDETVARAWLNGPNTALEAVPAEKIVAITGLTDVVAYLDARRAVI